jgi:curved DNA-binding protein CbpA
MTSNKFVDFYELMQLSPNADTETIESVFRHLAKKFHPDNAVSADTARFRQIVEAHRTLSDPEIRAGYDVEYQNYWNCKWSLASEAGNGSTFDNDLVTRERLLSLLYVQRRRTMSSPGIGEYEIARLLSSPPELVEFHLWYLMDKGWVVRLQNGLLAITAAGVDQVEQGRLLLSPSGLIELHNPAGEDAEKEGDSNLLVTDE